MIARGRSRSPSGPGRIRCTLGGMVVVLVAVTAAVPAAADFIYQPRNPAFGGPTSNGSYFQDNANTQSIYKEDTSSFFSDPITEFTESLQRRLLSELSRQITDSIFGENAQQSGSFSAGGVTVDFETIGSTIEITINDGVSQTVLEIPVQ